MLFFSSELSKKQKKFKETKEKKRKFRSTFLYLFKKVSPLYKLQSQYLHNVKVDHRGRKDAKNYRSSKNIVKTIVSHGKSLSVRQNAVESLCQRSTTLDELGEAQLDL